MYLLAVQSQKRQTRISYMNNPKALEVQEISRFFLLLNQI